MKAIKLYDTTLRDGAQTEGISFSSSDKLRIAERLDALGIPYVEGGFPGSNPKDMDFFRRVRKLKLKSAKVAAFGSTRRAHTPVGRDAGMRALLSAGTSVVTIFGKSWDLHVKEVLRATLDENLRMISESVSFLKSKKPEVIYDAEHFFDGYRSNASYALQTLKAAVEAGADWVVLCDTNGGMLTPELVRILEAVKSSVRIPLGIHVHNDGELAVANSIAAVEHGVEQVQGTINGYGERCGNANLVSIIANLQLKSQIRCLADSKLKELTETAHFVAEIANMKPADHQPFVGSSAFAHKGGVHINAMLKHSSTYEHIDPAVVGNHRRFLVSELSGRTSIQLKGEKFALALDRNTSRAKRILKVLQELEHRGYHFEAAEASLEILMRRVTQKLKRFFDLEGFRVIVEKDAQGSLHSEATIKVRVGGKEEHTAAEGDGPVNALDNALRKALEEFYPSLQQMHLSDFKVRVIEEKAGTAARVRVLIQSHDPEESWWTAGVSENIIEASWQALVDSIEYKLLKDLGHRKA